MNQNSLFHKREVRFFPQIQNNLIHKDTAILRLLLKSSGSSGSDKALWSLYYQGETLCSTSAGSMGLDVPKTNLVVVNSCPPSAWEFSQQVLFETCSFFNNFWWFLPPRILLAIALFKICLLSLGAREGAVVKLYASTSGGRRRRPLQRWSPSFTQTAPFAWKRALWRFFPWPAQMVNLLL